MNELHHFSEAGRPHRSEIGWSILKMLNREGEGGVAIKWCPTGEHMKGCNPQRVQVATRVDHLALDLFGTHVERRSQGDPHLSQVGRLTAGLGQAKVRHFDFPFRSQQDVLGLISRCTTPIDDAFCKAAAV